MPPHLRPGDVIVCNGATGVIWAKGTSTVTVMPAARARGPLHRADVSIGSYALATVSGPLLVNVARPYPVGDDSDIVVIGKLSMSERAALIASVAREKIAQASETAYDHAATFNACKPSFKSGGRRVGGANAGV